jgi:oxygen-dependent protoporphyrinogen oxidase
VLDKAAPTRRRLCSFQSGMGFLPKTLASKIGEDLMTGCQNLRLERAADSRAFEVGFERGSNHHKLICERIIIATPANIAFSLVAPISAELSGLLDEIDYPPLSIVSLAYDQSTVTTPLDGFGFLVPPSEGLNILGCVWNSSLFKDRAP